MLIEEGKLWQAWGSACVINWCRQGLGASWGAQCLAFEGLQSVARGLAYATQTWGVGGGCETGRWQR